MKLKMVHFQTFCTWKIKYLYLQKYNSISLHSTQGFKPYILCKLCKNIQLFKVQNGWRADILKFIKETLLINIYSVFFTEMSKKEIEEDLTRFRREILQYKAEYRAARDQLDRLSKSYEDSKKFSPPQRYNELKNMIKEITRTPALSWTVTICILSYIFES